MMVVVAVRKRLPTVDTLALPKLKEAMDSIDKYLAIVSLIFFILCMVFTVIHLG